MSKDAFRHFQRLRKAGLEAGAKMFRTRVLPWAWNYAWCSLGTFQNQTMSLMGVEDYPVPKALHTLSGCMLLRLV